MTRPLRVGDAFSGIGGMSLGLQMAGGFETRWFIEIDEWCRRVLAKHWPDVPQYGDIRDVRGSDVEAVDIIVGGFPCQPVSNAGKRLAQADDRWLWGEYLRLIRELRPRYVLVENVAGLLVRGFGDVLGGLAACGYDAEWQCIPAAAVGAPHIRDRVWVLAYPRCERRRIFPQSGNEHHGSGGEGDNRTAHRRHQDRELVALVPGVCEGVAADWWRRQSRVDRSLDGIPTELDEHRLKALGNAVVPQVVAYIGRLILEAERAA